MDLQQVFKNNEEWVKQKLNLDSNYFTNLAKGQSPDILYLGCSDSRVTAESLMGLEPGEAFVHRNIANIFHEEDLSVKSVLQYAVEHLGIKQIVVCGHYGCGGVNAAMGQDDLGDLNPWIARVKDSFKNQQEKLNHLSEDERHRRCVEINVEEQCRKLSQNSLIKEYRQKNPIEIHGWVFDLQTGRLKNLQLDF